MKYKVRKKFMKTPYREAFKKGRNFTNTLSILFMFASFFVIIKSCSCTVSSKEKNNDNIVSWRNIDNNGKVKGLTTLNPNYKVSVDDFKCDKNTIKKIEDRKLYCMKENAELVKG